LRIHSSLDFYVIFIVIIRK